MVVFDKEFAQNFVRDFAEIVAEDGQMELSHVMPDEEMRKRAALDKFVATRSVDEVLDLIVGHRRNVAIDPVLFALAAKYR